MTADLLNAVAVKENRLKFSASVAKDCLKNGGTEKACAALAIAADPPGDGITDVSMSLQYDPSKWIFDPGLSGFLCDFSVSGGCPAANASTGSFLISNLPDVNFTPGNPLPGSTVSLVNDDVHGLVSLSYSLSNPLNFSGDQDFFSFYFFAVTPFDATQTDVTFFDQAGNYDFTQTSATWHAIIGGSSSGCGSATPIDGFNIRSVPEPPTWLTLGILLVSLLGYKVANEMKGTSPSLSFELRRIQDTPQRGVNPLRILGPNNRG